MANRNSILVTGGAGFIGSHLVALLLDNGYTVTVLDNLDPQVHESQQFSNQTKQQLSCVVGDIRDRRLVQRLLSGADTVVHLASVVGVGQSMYEVERYVDSNTRGTAVLLDLIASSCPVEKLVIASSMSVYGEGKYYCNQCSVVRYPAQRNNSINPKSTWEPNCSECGQALMPIATDEDSNLSPTSIYAMSKRHQEEMSLLICKTYGIPVVPLRFFNVYGPGQALSNPYTGVVSIFLNRILSQNPPFIFEDGGQLRDFIHVSDVSRAILMALETDRADFIPINIGTGKPRSILDVAESLIKMCDSKLLPQISGIFRKGDVRHCYPEMSRAQKLLRFRAETDFQAGLSELVSREKGRGGTGTDHFETSLKQLKSRKLA